MSYLFIEYNWDLTIKEEDDDRYQSSAINNLCQRILHETFIFLLKIYSVKLLYLERTENILHFLSSLYHNLSLLEKQLTYPPYAFATFPTFVKINFGHCSSLT